MTRSTPVFRSRLSISLAPLVILLAFCGLAPQAFADIGPRWSDAELVALSEVILTGRVASVVSAWDATGGGIYTYVTLDVSDVIKGWVPANRVVIKQLGGRVGDLRLAVAGQASFSPGEETVVFLEVRPRDDSLYTAALWQGKWSVELDGTGQRVAARRDPGEARGLFRTGGERRGLAPFLSFLRARAGDASRRPAGRQLNIAPSEAPPSAPGGPIGAAFTLLGPARWHEADTGATIRVDVQTGGQPGLTGNGGTEIPAAIGLWNAAGSRLQLAFGAARGPRCFDTFESDGRISITFMDPCAEISNTGATLAIGGGWYNDADTRLVNGTTFSRFLQGTIVNNDSATALSFLQKSQCFKDITTHELGHAIGLGHSESSTAIMAPNIDNSCQTPAASGLVSDAITNRLGTDDIAGINFIYPGGSGPPPVVPGQPTLTVQVNGTAVVASWAASPNGGTPSSYRVQVGTATNLSDVFNQNVGLATSGTGNLPPGTYFFRVIATNAAGSATSPEVQQTIAGPAPCTSPPAAPASVTATGAGSAVTVSWPAVTGATSYRVQADLNGALVFNEVFGANVLLVSANPAPAGSYQVRVIAINACGEGAPRSTTFTLPWP
jgi:hypothetical protein